MEYPFFRHRRPSLHLMHGLAPPDAALVLKALAGTVTDCQNELELGYYKPANVFVYVVGNIYAEHK